MSSKYFLYIILLFIIISCKKEYIPAAITEANNYLVVDGYINADINGVTSFKLSRSRNLVDTVINIPELNAQVSIQGKSGSLYNLNGTNGIYKTTNLSLIQTDQYRINIKTSDGHQYVSDYVAVKKTPSIDSITWVQNNDVNIYVNSHDPTNSTKYYRWDYVETWEYLSPLEGELGLNGNNIIYVDSTTQTHKCWIDSLSTHILIGTSAALNADVISHQPIQTIIKDDERLTVRYSMLLSQYGITSDAYNYWLVIQKNSQQLGSLFDLQPSQLTGNIHPITNPNEPVIGFVGASTTQQKRIFINHADVPGWTTYIPHQDCGVTTIISGFIYYYPNPDFGPYYFSGAGSLVIARKECVDCRVKGGVNITPSFW